MDTLSSDIFRLIIFKLSTTNVVSLRSVCKNLAFLVGNTNVYWYYKHQMLTTNTMNSKVHIKPYTAACVNRYEVNKMREYINYIHSIHPTNPDILIAKDYADRADENNAVWAGDVLRSIREICMDYIEDLAKWHKFECNIPKHNVEYRLDLPEDILIKGIPLSQRNHPWLWEFLFCSYNIKKKKLVVLKKKSKEDREQRELVLKARFSKLKEEMIIIKDQLELYENFEMYTEEIKTSPFVRKKALSYSSF